MNEFVGDLDRLGLLILQAWETEGSFTENESSRRRRIESYLQKFEAAYGDLPDTIHTDVFECKFKIYSRADTAGANTLSTATFPVILYTILIAIGWLITLPPLELFRFEPTTSLGLLQAAFNPSVTPVVLAFLGAYFFSLQMLFRRYVRNDLGGPAYVAASIRIVLATIGIWTVAAVAPIIAVAGNTTNEFLLLAGFIFGVFPRVIWQIIQSLFQKVASFAVPSMMSQLPVSDLDGFTVWHQARLEEEDIETMPNMANADIVELMLSTPYPAEQIVDWIDQAILYTQLGPQEKQPDDDPRHKLRIYGIRTATSLLSASAESQRQGKRDAFEKILMGAKGDSLLPVLEASLTTNSNLALIQRWRRHSGMVRGADSTSSQRAAA